MNHRITVLFASAAALTFAAGSAFAQDQAPAAPAAPAAAAPAPPAPPTLAPAMSGSLAANGSPMSFDLGIFGSKVYVTGALTGLAQTADHAFAGEQKSLADIDNAQIMINKADGTFQYFVQVGSYALPALGAPYVKSGTATSANFGVVPQAFIKFAPNASFSIEGGKLPTLIGSEYTFSFENLNIQRGLLWGSEPAVSRGVQANYANGPIAVSVSWNDGFYSGQYNTVSGLGTWTISPTDTLAVAASGSVKKTAYSTFNNESVYNVMYTHTMGPWTIAPYFQYVSFPSYSPAGFLSGSQTGYALLTNYVFDAKSPLAGASLPLRVEYFSNSGAIGSASGWSLTATPTYQFKIYFIRAEVSYTSSSVGEFGSTGADKSQVRGLLETGVLF
jgi:hypothetical protein